MMTGSLNLFDSVQYTAGSEYSSRQGEKIDTLQIHHATMTSLSGLIGMMQPGGRTVSANGAMGNDGHLVEVVPLSQRAFTSASGYDRRSLTVEVCNTSLDPTWGISEACRLRLARLAVQMFRAGILGGLNRDYIIGHYEVPGTYATSCPGPDMNLDRIVWLANEMFKGNIPAGDGYTPIEIPQGSENNMLMIHIPNGGNNGQHLFAVFGPNFWLEFVGAAVANGFIKQIGAGSSSVAVTKGFWDHCKKSAGAV